MNEQNVALNSNVPHGSPRLDGNCSKSPAKGKGLGQAATDSDLLVDVTTRAKQEVLQPEEFVEAEHRGCKDAATNSIYDALACMEDILMEEDTEAAISGFCRGHMDSFENTDENKHEHMAIFQEYVALLERLLHARLRERMPHFDAGALRAWLEAQPAESLSSDALDTLLSASDFQAFKQHMLSYKTEGAMASLQPSVRGVVPQPQ